MRLALCALWALSGCASDAPGTKQSAEAASPPAAGAFLDACTAGSDCADGLCLGVGGDVGLCTHSCSRNAECPSGANWACSRTAEAEASVCVCARDGDEEQCGDGRDNDCDGRVDDCMACGSRLIQPDDRLHCGACGHACGVGARCVDRTCVCPEGADDCIAEGDVACRADADCDDQVACTVDRCVEGACIAELDVAVCGPGTSCDPRASECVAGEVCGDDADCADHDGCSAHERCDPVARRCLYDVLDGDGDGHAPTVCGGADCNDNDPSVHPGAAERCDGHDDDCDGHKDDHLADDVCGAGMACVAGVCACAPGMVICDDTCKDLSRDADHCGGCGNACAAGDVCNDGVCGCGPGSLACAGVCRSLASFADDDAHCGGCGAACRDGEECAEGACVCTAGSVQCADACVRPAEFAHSHAHCGGCDQRCDGACVEGACAAASRLALGFGSTCVVFEDGSAGCVGRLGGDAFRPLRDAQGQLLRGIARLVLNDAAPAPYLCALLGNGALLCGGDPLLRELHDPLTLAPVYAQGLRPLVDVADVALGADASCALGKAGEVWCWGPNKLAGAGTGSAGASVLASPVRDAAGQPLDHVVSIALMPLLPQACALRASGELLCWGGNENGEAVPGADAQVPSATPVQDAAGKPLAGVRDVAVAVSASCAVLAAGDVVCWGANDLGQLGRPSAALAGSAPLPVVDAGGAVVRGASVRGGYGGFCALAGSGELACWGANAKGQLGDGSSTDRAYAVLSLRGVEQLDVGLGHRCALAADGALLCWGDDARQGSVVIGGDTLFAQPVRDGAGSALRAVRQVAVGGQHSCILAADGQVACWGDNGLGQLGRRGAPPALRPRALPWP